MYLYYFRVNYIYIFSPQDIEIIRHDVHARLLL